MIEPSPHAMQAWCNEERARGKRVGFVPTMGALHEGHLDLVRALLPRVDTVVVSIFVNPSQFGPNEDFNTYPRTLAEDVEKLAALGVARVFAPSSSKMVPETERTQVRVRQLCEHLCGPLRPGHFDGVATVVSKLFAIVGACDAAFGRKDYQQFKIVQRLAADLFLPVNVLGIPTKREADGLAMSSRNRYLSEEDRHRARLVPGALRTVVRAHRAGEDDASRLRALFRDALRETDKVEYAEVCDADTLVPLEGQVPARALFVLAVRIGTTRLIDNLVTTEDGWA
jgi:pantoate--beta-alanine ligase